VTLLWGQATFFFPFILVRSRCYTPHSTCCSFQSCFFLYIFSLYLFIPLFWHSARQSKVQ